jgi:hypothetical protein
VAGATNAHPAMKTKRHRSKTRAALPMDQLDQAVDCCRNIETTALLLETCGHHKTDDELNSAMVANAGAMIYAETVRLRGVLAAFRISPKRAS